jgi:hypothetical protein
MDINSSSIAVRIIPFLEPTNFTKKYPMKFKKETMTIIESISKRFSKGSGPDSLLGKKGKINKVIIENFIKAKSSSEVIEQIYSDSALIEQVRLCLSNVLLVNSNDY